MRRVPLLQIETEIPDQHLYKSSSILSINHLSLLSPYPRKTFKSLQIILLVPRVVVERRFREEESLVPDLVLEGSDMGCLLSVVRRAVSGGCTKPPRTTMWPCGRETYHSTKLLLHPRTDRPPDISRPMALVPSWLKELGLSIESQRLKTLL